MFNGDVDLGCIAAKAGRQMRHDHRRTQIVQPDIEAALRISRAENRRLQGAADLLQGVPDRLLQRQRAFSRLHAVDTADEQVVLGQMTQTAQRCADRRLTQADAVAGARHIALKHQRIEHQQQVEVDGGQLHSLYPVRTGPMGRKPFITRIFLISSFDFAALKAQVRISPGATVKLSCSRHGQTLFHPRSIDEAGQFSCWRSAVLGSAGR